jgi:hypothetical protein
VHVSPPPAPVTPPPPPPVFSPPPPPPPVHSLALAPKPKPKPKPQRRHPKVVKHTAPAAPVPVSRGAGGPARLDVGLPVTPVAFLTQQPVAAAPVSTATSEARLFLLFAIALGLALVFASALPGTALRPAFVHEVVVVHRLDLALVGGSIVVLVGALYLLTG